MALSVLVSDENEEQPGEEHLRIQGKKATLANQHPDEEINFLLVAVDEERQWEGLRLQHEKHFIIPRVGPRPYSRFVRFKHR